MIRWIIGAGLIVFAVIKADAQELRVLMLDSGVPEKLATYSTITGSELSPYVFAKHKHSSAVYQMIISGEGQTPSCLNMRVDWCSWYTKSLADGNRYLNCLSKAVDGNYDIVNLSLVANYMDRRERDLISKLKERSIVVAAAGNEGCRAGLYKCNAYPAAYSRGPADSVIAVAATDITGKVFDFSNRDDTGLTVDFLGEGYYYINGGYSYMVGTSMAAAMYSNKLIKEMCPSRKGAWVGKE